MSNAARITAGCWRTRRSCGTWRRSVSRRRRERRNSHRRRRPLATRLAARSPRGRRVRPGTPRPRASSRPPPCRAERSAVKEYPYWLDTLPSAEVRRQKYDSTETRTCRRAPTSSSSAPATRALSAARQLARAGASVVVIEREQAGWGASSRNGGQVLTGMKLEPATLVARFGERARAAAVRHRHRLDRQARGADRARKRSTASTSASATSAAAFKPAHFDAFRDEQALLARVFDHRGASRAARRAAGGDRQRRVSRRARRRAQRRR